MIAGLPWWLSGKEFACNAGDAGLIPRSERGGHGNPLHYSFLENPLHRGAWQVLAVHEACKKSDMTEATGHARLLMDYLSLLIFTF